jgi:hypothetical protein
VWRRQLHDVTPAQVNQAWRRWIDPCSVQVVLVTPDAQAMKNALLAGDPTPIKYQSAAQRAPEQLAKDRQIASFSFGQPKDGDIEIVLVEKMFE